MESMKKAATMCGTLMAPLCVGRRALILHNGGYVHTSTVVAIQSVDAREIRFGPRTRTTGCCPPLWPRRPTFTPP